MPPQSKIFQWKIFFKAFGCPHRGASRDHLVRTGWRKFLERIFDPPPRRIKYVLITTFLHRRASKNLMVLFASHSCGIQCIREALRRGVLIFSEIFIE
jgi:hypothetical protein